MVLLTKLDGSEFTLNADLIETVEEKPDTTIRLTTKNFLIVKESMDEVTRKVIHYRQSCARFPSKCL